MSCKTRPLTVGGMQLLSSEEQWVLKQGQKTETVNIVAVSKDGRQAVR